MISIFKRHDSNTIFAFQLKHQACIMKPLLAIYIYIYTFIKSLFLLHLDTSLLFSIWSCINTVWTLLCLLLVYCMANICFLLEDCYSGFWEILLECLVVSYLPSTRYAGFILVWNPIVKICLNFFTSSFLPWSCNLFLPSLECLKLAIHFTFKVWKNIPTFTWIFFSFFFSSLPRSFWRMALPEHLLSRALILIAMRRCGG